MPLPIVHIVELLIRERVDGQVKFLLHPHSRWRPTSGGEPYLVFPTRKTITDLGEPFRRGEPIERFIDDLMRREFGLADEDYAINEEIGPVEVTMPAIKSGELKQFVIYPVDVWVSPGRRESLCSTMGGLWLSPTEAIAHPRTAPTVRSVMSSILERESGLEARYSKEPAEEARDEMPKRLLAGVAEKPGMYLLASKWFARNKGGVRYLPGKTVADVLAAGNRAFNLRVADPYLRYQRQGVGFTWSFFTHKDGQDIHVHSAPTVEIYGVIEGRLEAWWKPYHDQGTSAWSCQVLGPGDWLEVEALQCHAVAWQGEGLGVVFKAGPGPLAEVGRLGVKGKTTCDGCICMKPREVCELVRKR